MTTLIAALSFGFLGSAHCAAMCGGFYLMAGRGALRRQAPYLLGKTTTYAVLGAIAGGIGATVAMFEGPRVLFTLIIGVAFVISGFVWIGLIPQPSISNRVGQSISKLISITLKRTGPMAPFTLGLANGLLPCGLLYGALGLAATSGTVAMGALSMTVFGIATIPSLAFFGYLARKVGDPILKRTHLAGGVAMIVFGVITLMRAMPMDSAMMH